MPQVVKSSAFCVHAPTIPYTYILNGIPLKEADHTKYIDNHISKDLKWNKHINVTTANDNRSLGFLKRNLNFFSNVLREKAYMRFVSPQIEHGTAIWTQDQGSKIMDPTRSKWCDDVRWTLKRYHNTSSVSNMLRDRGWKSLEQRRADSRLTLLYKIYNGHVPINASKHLRSNTRRSRYSHSNSFIPLSTSTSSQRLTFFPRTTNQWNILPQSIFDNADLTSFKHSVSSISHSPVI